MKKIKLAIVDDNVFLMKAIEEKLSFFEEFEVVMKKNNGKEFTDNISPIDEIDVVLMDIEMPIMNGIEATNLCKQKLPNTKIIMLTVFDNDENIFNAIKAGADGYLLKEVNPKDLYNGILETLNGGAAMNPSIAMKTLKLLRNPIDFELDKDAEDVILSSREIDVLEQLSKGLSYTVIADNLFLSPHTIRKHIENIYKKLQVHSKIEAVQKARRNNLI
ncbi:MAG: response regulator transcription factor [Chitinophagales bacterium]|nr:response regulator transcription factor [Chitinophagales bacterium]